MWGLSKMAPKSEARIENRFLLNDFIRFLLNHQLVIFRLLYSRVAGGIDSPKMRKKVLLKLYIGIRFARPIFGWILPKMWKSLFHFRQWLFLREDFCCNISSFCTESNLLWGVDKKWHWLKINGGLSRWRRLPWEKKSVCSAALPPHRSASLFSRLELLKNHTKKAVSRPAWPTINNHGLVMTIDDYLLISILTLENGIPPSTPLSRFWPHPPIPPTTPPPTTPLSHFLP